MSDLHVVALRYRLKTDEGTDFASAQAIEDETDLFHLKLENGIAKFELKKHFASPELPQMEIEEYLRAWELADALQRRKREIRFEYEKAEIVDREPPLPGSGRVILGTASVNLEAVTLDATIHVARNEYPRPPKNFKASPDADFLWYRYERYLRGQDLLLGVGYFCLTWVERAAGSRNLAHKKYNISCKVLAKLGTLTSERGDKWTARKVDNESGPLIPLSPAEVAWVEAAIAAVIRRIGEVDAGVSPPILGMNDLP